MRRLTCRKTIRLAAIMFVMTAAAQIATAQRIGTATVNDLNNTSWQLVKFTGSDGTTFAPDERSKYTITFGANGRASVRVDCNRGGGSWKYKGPNQIQFGAMSVTREKCGANSLYDRIVREGASIRNYSIKDGRLFLSLLEEGGTYELEPLRSNRNR